MPDSPSAATAALTPSIGLLYEDFPAEHPVTRRILERYPDGQGAFRPHERSRSLSELATHVADIVNRGTAVLETDGLDVDKRIPVPPLDSGRELLAHFDDAVTRFTASLARADLEQLGQNWAMRREGRVLVELPRRVLLRRLMMSHLIHHRAQLGVYYRLLGVAVPGAYGPSADD
jgi:uncharacterized damage-inducible protein DinB